VQNPTGGVDLAPRIGGWSPAPPTLAPRVAGWSPAPAGLAAQEKEGCLLTINKIGRYLR